MNLLLYLLINLIESVLILARKLLVLKAVVTINLLIHNQLYIVDLSTIDSQDSNIHAPTTNNNSTASLSNTKDDAASGGKQATDSSSSLNDISSQLSCTNDMVRSMVVL